LSSNKLARQAHSTHHVQHVLHHVVPPLIHVCCKAGVMAFDYILYLTTYCINATRFASSLMRGVFRRRSCKAERGVASCGGGSNRSPREGRDLVQIRRQCRRRNVRRAAAGAFAACPPKLRRRQGPGRQTPRWSAERRACVRASERTRRASPARLTRAERRDKDKKMRLSALRPPLDPVGESKANPRTPACGNETTWAV
jgi:hypothetical protein